MPQRWKDLVAKIKKNLQGQTNPRTKKPYSESDIYAIAMAQYKKMYGSSPKREELIALIKEDNPNFLLLEYFTPIENEIKEGKMSVRGIALNASTSRNKVKYIPEEMEKSAHTLIGAPILNSHKTDDVFNILGRVTEAHYDAQTQSIPFAADISDSKAQEFIKDGRIRSVSIGANAQDLVNEGEEDVVTARGIEFLELSFVPIAGVKNAAIEQAITEKYDFIKEINKTYQILENENIGETMTETEDIKKIIREEITASLTEMKTKETEETKIKEAQLKETAEKEAKEKELASLKEQVKTLTEELAKNKVMEQPKAEITVQEELTPKKNGLIVEKYADGTTFYSLDNCYPQRNKVK